MTILSSRKANTSIPQYGNKLQGLGSTTNKSALAINTIQGRAWGENRKNVNFCINTLGGIGRGKSQFASNADAPICPPWLFAEYFINFKIVKNWLRTTIQIILDASANLKAHNIADNFQLCYIGNQEKFITDVDNSVGGNFKDVMVSQASLGHDISGKIFTHIENPLDSRYTIYFITDASGINSTPVQITLVPDIKSKIIFLNSYSNLGYLNPKKEEENNLLGRHQISILNNNFILDISNGIKLYAQYYLNSDGYGLYGLANLQAKRIECLNVIDTVLPSLRGLSSDELLEFNKINALIKNNKNYIIPSYCTGTTHDYEMWILPGDGTKANDLVMPIPNIQTNYVYVVPHRFPTWRPYFRVETWYDIAVANYNLKYQFPQFEVSGWMDLMPTATTYYSIETAQDVFTEIIDVGWTPLSEQYNGGMGSGPYGVVFLKLKEQFGPQQWGGGVWIPQMPPQELLPSQDGEYDAYYARLNLKKTG